MPSKRSYASVALAALALLAPVTGAAAVQSNSPGVPADGPATQQPSVQENATNYTRLYLGDRYRSVDLEPGENTTFEVTVENGEDEPVTVSPDLFTPPAGERPVPSEWVTVDPSEATIEAGEEATVTVAVDVPADAKMARYRGILALTDEMISYDGRPERPVHAAQFSVEVTRPPTVFVVPLNEEYSQLRAGESYTHTVRVNNTGAEAVPLNPTVKLEERRRYRPGQKTAERDWFTVDAPAQVPAGGSALVNVTVAVPEGASRGSYDAEVTLGLRDPARADRGDYWQRVNMHFQVWKQPEEPFTKSFGVSESTESLTVKLSAGDRRRDSTDESPEFDVTLVGPDGETYDPQRVEVTNRGYVSLADTRRTPSRDGAYATRGDDRAVRYRLEDPESGEWTVRITPQNVAQFRYELIRDEAGEASTPRPTETETSTATPTEADTATNETDTATNETAGN